MAFTVRALDAGPVITCERLEVDDQIKVCFSGITSLVMKHGLRFWNLLVFVSLSPIQKCHGVA